VAFDTILVPIDGSSRALAGVRQARRLARLFSARLWIVTVVDPIGRDVDPQAVLDAGKAEAGDIPCETEIIEGIEPEKIIARLNDEHPEALCCMATRGRHPAGRMLLGSVAREVVDRAREPVVLVGPKCRDDPDVAIDRIVIALDGTPDSETALDWAPRWASSTGASMDLIRIVYPLPDPAAKVPPSDAQMDDLRYVHQAAKRLDDDKTGVRSLTVQATDPVEAIRDHLDYFAHSLVAMATRPASPVTQALLGSTAARLVRVSPSPVALTSRSDSRLRF
jgi:nucleotide-binding universal stress UspA family protein